MTEGHPLRSTYAEINLGHLKENLNSLRKDLSPQSFFCPMVKANAYGHGDIQISRALVNDGVQWLGVSLVEEGIRLRNSGIKSRILVFAIFDRINIPELIQSELTPVISTFEDIENLSYEIDRQNHGQLRIHIKFDTGMSRLGFSWKEVEKVRAVVSQKNNLIVEGLCTHLSTSEDTLNSGGVTEEQINRFHRIWSEWVPKVTYCHVSNSGGRVLGTSAVYGFRPGISIYGVYPEFNRPEDANFAQAKFPLKPVMSLKSKIGLIKKINKGDCVSYSGRWTATQESVIAVIPIGYADGYPRALTNKGSALVNGCRVPVIGSVCMDYLMLDLSKIIHTNLEVGHEVVLFGQQGNAQISASEVAHLADTISYEILTGIGVRTPRIFKEGVG